MEVELIDCLVIHVGAELRYHRVCAQHNKQQHDKQTTRVVFLQSERWKPESRLKM